ncbi:MAG: M16 family metallopeptidase [Arachnia sp.]
MNRPDVTLSTTWRFPEPDSWSLANGLQVLAFDLPGQPMAAVELVLPAPLHREPAEREGVAALALHSADEGTNAHPDGGFADELERGGAELRGSAGQHHTGVGLDVAATRLPRALELLHELITTPQYDVADIDRHIEHQLANIDARLSSPAATTRQAFRTALFGAADRRGRPAGGTRETLARLQREDVVRWQQARWRPGGATLVLAGDLRRVNVAEAVAGLEQWTGDACTEPDPAGRAAPAVTCVDFPEAVQVTLQLGALTIGRTHPQWAALKVAGHALAGGFASRINLELREKRGITYGIGGGLSPRPRDGLFTVAGNVSVETAVESLRYITGAITLEHEFTAAEIADAQSFLTGVSPLANETAADIARQAAILAAADIPVGFVNELQNSLASTTPADATAALRDLVTPEQLTIAVAGPAETVAPALAKAGFDPQVVTPIS